MSYIWCSHVTHDISVYMGIHTLMYMEYMDYTDYSTVQYGTVYRCVCQYVGVSDTHRILYTTVMTYVWSYTDTPTY